MTEIKFGKLKKGDLFIFNNTEFIKTKPVFKNCCTIASNAEKLSNNKPVFFQDSDVVEIT